MRLLMVEDDELLGSATKAWLRREGFAVDLVHNGRDFHDSLQTQEYGFALLDLCLPDVSGESLLKSMRHSSPKLPVIVTSARAGVHDKVTLLSLGADDYLSKPFDLDELTARIRSVLRRFDSNSAESDASLLPHGELVLHTTRHSATWQGQPVELTRREYRVLETLVRRKNEVLTRAQLEDALYGWGEEVESNTIEVYIHFLRRKFDPALIHTIRGVGYQLASLRQDA